jgi:hypothetical protein
MVMDFVPKYKGLDIYSAPSQPHLKPLLWGVTSHDRGLRESEPLLSEESTTEYRKEWTVEIKPLQ